MEIQIGALDRRLLELDLVRRAVDEQQVGDQQDGDEPDEQRPLPRVHVELGEVAAAARWRRALT